MTPRPLSPEERMTYSYLLGSGLYSGLQLKNHILDSEKPEEADDNRLVVKLPKDRLRGVAKKASILDTIMPGFSMAKGFQDKKKDYTTQQKTMLKSELEEAEHQYLNSLVSSKKASFEKEATPHVDALCLGMLKEIEKNADESISDGSLGRALGSLAHPVTKHLPTKDSLKDNFVTQPLLASILGTYLFKKHMNKKDTASGDNNPLNVEIEAI